MLSSNQLMFIEARKTTASDQAACDAIGIARQTLHRWKKNSSFMEEYNPAIKGILVIPTQSRIDLVAEQVEALTFVLPEIVKEHIRLALRAREESVRLRAIVELYKSVGFGTDSLLPVGKYNKVLIQVLNLMQPQVQAEAKRRGLDIQEIIDVAVKQLPADTGDVS